MIVLYSGTPGSGKSYHAVKRVFTTLFFRKYVIANFALKFSKKQEKRGYDERFFYYQNEEITIDNLVEFSLEKGLLEKGKEGQCLVVIDEAGGRFNCRDFQNSQRKEWIDFFSQHRKLGFDFILVAQQDRMIDRQIRGYIEYEEKHRKVNSYLFLPIKVFVSVEFWYQQKVRLGAHFCMFNKRIASAYDHMKMFSGFTLSKELLKKIEEKRLGMNKSPVMEGFDIPVSAIFKDSEEKE